MLGAFQPERLLAVINTTSGKLVYAASSQVAGYGGTFSTGTYTNDTLTYQSSNAGQTSSDILQILYDSETASQNISASDGTQVLTTTDAMSLQEGLNVNLLNSSFGGQLGNPIPLPNNNNALSMGFLNGSVLSAPRMDPVTNELIVQSAPGALQDVNITSVAGNLIAGSNLPVTISGFGVGSVSLGQNTMANSMPVVLASNQSAIPITTTSPIEVTESVTNIDVLGASIFGQRNNQVELSFNSVPSSGITIATSGGATATASNGHTVFALNSVAGGANVTGTSTLTTSYRAGHEVYCMFTAAFNNLSTTPTIGQIGLWDGNDGFTIGFFTGTFGIAAYSGGFPTLVYSNNFNTDLLNGGSTSKFTRDGAPEAIDLTKSNLFRIRFAWLGSGNIYYEVFSPDGEWVLFHNIRQPNSAFNPSITNPNLPVRVRVERASGTANANIATACWAAGTTSDVAPLSATITDSTQAKMVRAVIEGKTTGGGGGYVPVKVTPSGALAVEIGSAVLPTGASTSALQTTGNNSLNNVDGLLYSMLQALRQIANPISTDVASGRMRVVLDPLGGAQTLGAVTTVGTVTTVSTVTSMSQIGAMPANSMVMDTMQNMWANSIRGRIT